MLASSLWSLLHDSGTSPSHLQIGLHVVLKRKGTDREVAHKRTRRTRKDLHNRRSADPGTEEKDPSAPLQTFFRRDAFDVSSHLSEFSLATLRPRQNMQTVLNIRSKQSSEHRAACAGNAFNHARPTAIPIGA